MPASLFDGAAPGQRAAAMRTGAVLVLAGAGTGKTRTLSLGVAHRIRERGIHPSRILVVTFTNKAAGEMAGRIRAALGGDGVPRWMGTFHGLAARQLRTEPEVAGLRPGFDIIDADDTLPRRHPRRAPLPWLDCRRRTGTRLACPAARGCRPRRVDLAGLTTYPLAPPRRATSNAEE